MSALNRHDNFAGRVAYAAAFMAAGRSTACARSFDNCFENYDGDAVLAALVRRARNNPKLADALPKYITATALAKAEDLARKSPREIAAAAAEMRRVAHENFAAWLAESDANKATA